MTGTIKDPANTGTSKGVSRAINRGPIRKFMPNYVNVNVIIQGHGHSTGALTVSQKKYTTFLFGNLLLTFLSQKELTAPQFWHSLLPLHVAIWQWVSIWYLSAPPPPPYLGGAPLCGQWSALKEGLGTPAACSSRLHTPAW